MDKKKTISNRLLCSLFVIVGTAMMLSAQEVTKIEFCGREYQYGVGNNNITLFLKFYDSSNNKAKVESNDIKNYLRIYENGGIDPVECVDVRKLQNGRIPDDYTISVLIDLGIDTPGKEQISNALRSLVESASDSSIYVSFYGASDDAPKSELITTNNFDEIIEGLKQEGHNKYLYSALYEKLLEFDKNQVNNHDEFDFNLAISKRSDPDKNILFLFIDGSSRADSEDKIDYLKLTDGNEYNISRWPRTFAFYYGSNLDEDTEQTIAGITGKAQKLNLPDNKKGKYVPTSDLDEILEEFSQIVESQKYDFAYTYKAKGRYQGEVRFSAAWDGEQIGDEGALSIGLPERPWPESSDTFSKYLIALLVTLLTITFFYCVMKIIIPFFKSKKFEIKYYRSFVPEAGVNKQICYYCKEYLKPGEKVVAKCAHIMHVECWKANHYHCSEYGQNCNSGIQDHVDWKEILSLRSLRDCHQAISGIIVGFICWIIYELLGRGLFEGLSLSIADMFLTDVETKVILLEDCAKKVSSFLTIGLLLGFFLSLIFRYNDDYRKKNWTILIKIIGLSLLTSLIGFLAFAFGGIILCMMLSSITGTSIPWYCSLPAYLLFSVCTSLSLTLQSSIPIKSAMLGGLCSAIIGFIVLYFSSITNSSYPWMNMLLNFIIYGGGLGASLVTIRMLAEKYFLRITNGVKAGVRIPIHKWMGATGGGNSVTIGMTSDCEIQMNWEKSNKVAKEHAVLYIDQARQIPVIKPLASGVIYNSRADLPVERPAVLSNGDTIKIGDTIFRYEETE